MAKKKELSIAGAFRIFLEGVKLYFMNIIKFVKYMTFPVLGQILGVGLIFTTVHLFVNNIDKIISINPALDNISVIMLVLLLCIIPSFMLFFASFWKYLVAMGALNSMAVNLISGAKLEDLSIHNDTVNRRMPTFLGLLFVLSIISILGIIPLLWAIFLIIMIYLCLVFQIFALEENLGTFEILKKSIQTIKGNFFKTTLLLFLLWFFTYQFLPNIISFGLERIDAYSFLSIPVEAFCKNLPLNETQETINTILSAINSNANFSLEAGVLAKSIVISIIGAIIIGYTLPLRSICCTLLYKELETKKLKEKKIKEL